MLPRHGRVSSMAQRVTAWLCASIAVIAQAGILSASPQRQALIQRDDATDLPRLKRLELAGNPLGAYPHFEFVRTFMEGAPVHVAIDPTRHPGIVGRSGNLFVVAHQEPYAWEQNPALVDARGQAQAVFFGGTGVQADTILLQQSATLS